MAVLLWLLRGVDFVIRGRNKNFIYSHKALVLLVSFMFTCIHDLSCLSIDTKRLTGSSLLRSNHVLGTNPQIVLLTG